MKNTLFYNSTIWADSKKKRMSENLSEKYQQPATAGDLAFWRSKSENEIARLEQRISALETTKNFESAANIAWWIVWPITMIYILKKD